MPMMDCESGRLSVSGKKDVGECVYITFSLVSLRLQADEDWKRPYSREDSPLQGLTSVVSASALQPSSHYEPNARSVMSVSISIFVWPPPFRAEKLSKAGRSTGSSVKSVAWHGIASVDATNDCLTWFWRADVRVSFEMLAMQGHVLPPSQARSFASSAMRK
ncbi:hypothetical protein FPOAC1_004371 [Fusarium poae]|uniref:hypothetical protein n=1 Tax=Fusarium poae TaxID=36050 RepID=UPI001CEADF5F|nr:hypothetical protein FPOAC1_004371 [Fusarium poae]KAG8671132.1 hypothetical protein FPOAC1_004371 [Fusarium poae]